MNPVAKIAITGVNLAASALVGKGLSYVWKGVTGNEILIYYPDMDPTKAAIYIVCSVLSGLVMSGIGSWALTKALAKTGVLASLASGAQARTVQA